MLFFLGSRFGHLAVKLIGATWRMHIIGAERLQEIRTSKVPLMMITWHGRMLVPVWHCRGTNIVAMISQHQDGEMVARLVQKLGYETVRGSSTRGGSQAALEMLKRIELGQTAAIICDGPRGPIYKMKPGAPFLALQSHAVVIPATFAAKNRWTFHSWDRFVVPMPFSKVVLMYGEPIPARESDNSVEEFGQELEDALNRLTEEAEAQAKARYL